METTVIKIEEDPNQADIIILQPEESEMQLKVERLNVDIAKNPITQVSPPKVTPEKRRNGPTNYERYNVLVRAYIDAHPHLPRQMQYAEAQQVWRSVRMDPEGAYLHVLRSLHGMALLAQASLENPTFKDPEDQHPLMRQALDPNWCQYSPPTNPPVPMITAGPMTPTTPKAAPAPKPRKPRGRPPKARDWNQVQLLNSQFPKPKEFIVVPTISRPLGKRPRGRPPKPKVFVPIPTGPIVKRRPGRPRKIRPEEILEASPSSPVPNASPPEQESITVPSSPVPPSSSPPPQPQTSDIQVLNLSPVSSPIISVPSSPVAISTSPVVSTIAITSSVTTAPVASPVTTPSPSLQCKIPKETTVTCIPSEVPAASLPVIELVTTLSSQNPETPLITPEQWQPQPGLSFVQGNGLKMILSRVQNGRPLPEYRRKRHRRSRAASGPMIQNVMHHMEAGATPGNINPASPIQGQAADSTVMDIVGHIQMPGSQYEYSQDLHQSPDQPFTAAILQYLLDLAELLGPTASFLISKETEQGPTSGIPDMSIYTGWLIGDQNVGPKLIATTRMATRTNDMDCLNELVNNEDFRDVIRTPYGRVKPVAIMILEGKKMADLQLLDDAIDCFKDWDLDSIILASHPKGDQHVLSTLDGNDGENMSPKVCTIVTDADQPQRIHTIELEQWKSKHLRGGQYYLQLVKCGDQNCCRERRTPLHKILSDQGFLPPPVPFAKGEQGPMAPRFEERNMANFGRLCERLVMSALVPRTAFRELPFDFYCPSAHDSISKRVCFDCGHYFPNFESRKLHNQLLHIRFENIA